MSIYQISQIQHRQGIRADLPESLASGELGWCLDTRELFIGNSPGYGANTEILTQYSNNGSLISVTFSGSVPSIAAQTGPTINTPIYQTLNDILNDSVTLKKYGAKADGITDDTGAINRALFDLTRLYRLSGDARSLLVLRATAGTYIISQPLVIPPWIQLIGDGRGHTIFKMVSSTAAYMVVTGDSLQQTGSSIGNNGAALPTGIRVQGIDFINTNSSDIFVIQRATDIVIDNCTLKGVWTSGSGSSPNTHGIVIQSLGNATVTGNIVVSNSSLSNTVYGMYSDDPVQGIKVINCDIGQTWQGITLGLNANNGGPVAATVTETLFHDIDNMGLANWASGIGVASTNNRFVNVGDATGANPIYWAGVSQKNTSIGDRFTRSDGSAIFNGNPNKNLILNSQLVSLPNNTGVNLPLTLGDGVSLTSSTGLSYNTAVTTSVVLNYSLNRGTSRRTGQLFLVSDGNTAVVSDTGVNLGSNPGITFGANVVSSTMNLNFTSTSTGASAIMHYNQSSWLN